jgi:ATP-dependent Lhr-like helicase
VNLWSGFDPLIQEWFQERVGEPTEPQVLGWPQIRSGHDVLISAPTGSGKTLAAFLHCLDGLVRQARTGSLPDAVQAVYVSPLKALSNDIQKNLERPLAEIRELAERKGVALAPIRTALRTGDTNAYKRQQMLDRPPHILVTTPESLFILLTARRGRETLGSARTLIVDEIHAVVDDKRGAHLALSIERLQRLVTEQGGALQRIGLSATVSPIEQVAQFLRPGSSAPSARIVQIGHSRPMKLAVETMDDELGAVASQEMWGQIHDRVAELIQQNRTTLIFVNTRRLAERVTHALEERLGDDRVAAHHGSLAKQLRLDAEQRLKCGELRAVVATASLELGIDIGTVDLVCQIGSPRSIAVALQRVGRSGHWVGAIPHGVFFPTTRDELIECAALVRAIRNGDLDRLEIPEAPLDVLAQQIVAEVAASESWREQELFDWVRTAYPYRSLARQAFDQVIGMLADGISTSRGRRGAYLHHDRVNGVLKPRRGARLAAITSGGAIPDTAQYQVVAEPEGSLVGTIDEDFAIESSVGDIFLLGTTSWRIRRVEPGRVRVEDAHGASPTVPFWLGEAPGRTWELSLSVGALREEIDALGAGAARMLSAECGLSAGGAEQAIAYVAAGKRILGVMPTIDTIVAERFFDESGGMQLIIHAPFGARVNRAWGLSLRKRFCRSFNLELQAAATDNGINISLTEQHAFPLDLVFEFLKPQTLEHTLTQALLDSPMFTVRWRWNVSRALAVLRFSGGRKTPPPLQRMRSEDLLASVFPDQAACAENLSGEIRIPDHPLVAETIRDCLHEAMDLNRLAEIVRRIQDGEIRTMAIETPEPSPFCHELLNANPWAFLDDAPLEERRARAVQMRRSLDTGSLGADAALSEEAIAQVSDEIAPVARDADELHDVLLSVCVVPPMVEWEDFFAALAGAGRATLLTVEEGEFWVAAERLELVRRIYPQGHFSPKIAAVEPRGPQPDGLSASIAEVLRGWLDAAGPATVEDWSARLALEPAQVEAALIALEAEGQAMRGRFSPGLEEGQTEWCNRRVLARIHRLTLHKLRREIEPVSSADFMRFLQRWQHAASGTRLHGADGLLQVIRQLEGFEAPAAAWESSLLPARVAGYKGEYLDQLCLAGEVMWGRLSPHAAADRDEGASSKRIRPTRAAPLSFFLRENSRDLLHEIFEDELVLSHAARDVLQTLKANGASFFADIQQASGRLSSEVEEALWELASAGLVSADGFDNLRALIDPRRRAGQAGRRNSRPRNASGRWALLPRSVGEADVESAARRLLTRWGVVFRDLMKRESSAPPWRSLLQEFRRMEARGEVRGGRFVASHVGEQFALPEAVDLLRSVRRSAPDGETLAVAASDPLNLVGIVLPGDRINVLSAGRVVLQDGRQAPDAAAVLRAPGAAGEHEAND